MYGLGNIFYVHLIANYLLRIKITLKFEVGKFSTYVNQLITGLSLSLRKYLDKFCLKYTFCNLFFEYGFRADRYMNNFKKP